MLVLASLWDQMGLNPGLSVHPNVVLVLQTKAQVLAKGVTTSLQVWGKVTDHRNLVLTTTSTTYADTWTVKYKGYLWWYKTEKWCVVLNNPTPSQVFIPEQYFINILQYFLKELQSYISLSHLYQQWGSFALLQAAVNIHFHIQQWH